MKVEVVNPPPPPPPPTEYQLTLSIDEYKMLVALSYLHEPDHSMSFYKCAPRGVQEDVRASCDSRTSHDSLMKLRNTLQSASQR